MTQEFEEKEINLREYFLVIIKRRWMILTILLFVVTITGIYSFLQTPTYRSSSTLYIDRLNYNIVPEVVSEQYSYQGYDNFFRTQYKLLKTKALAERVVQRLNLTVMDLAGPKDRDKIKPSSGSSGQTDPRQSALADQLLTMVEINPIKDTTLCEIAFVAKQPKLAMILANAWADEYVDYSLSSSYEYTQKAEELLVDQVKELQEQIAEKEKVLQNYSEDSQVVKLSDDRSMNSASLEDMNKSLGEATQLRIAAQVHYQDLKSHGKDAVPEVASNNIVNQLKTQLNTLQQTYTEKSKTYKPDYPEMLKLRTQMDQLKRDIDHESDEVYSKILAAAQSNYSEAANKENALKSQMDSDTRSTIQANRKEVDYDRIKVELDNKKALLDTLLKKQSETGVSVEVKEKKATTIRIVERAEMPTGIYQPNISHNIYFSLMMGLIIGIAMAFLLEYLDSSLKNGDDVTRLTQMPFLGIVPTYMIAEDAGHEHGSRAVVKKENVTNSPSEATDLLTLHNPNSIAAEAFKTVRTSLLLSFPEAPPKTILVTSSRPGEGKTFVACNLAISLAQLDKKVILMDADMRNPRIHRVWGLKNDIGLSRFLTSDMKSADVIRASKSKGVSLISSGVKTPRPAELIASKRLEELLHELEGEYDHIIIDSPPLIPVADSLILAAKVNCVVMVIQGGVTPRDVVNMAKQKLAKSDAVMAGVVLNNIDLTDPYYYYRYYTNYGYGYGKDKEKDPSASPKFLQ